jgi:hypothetical protein
MRRTVLVLLATAVTSYGCSDSRPTAPLEGAKPGLQLSRSEGSSDGGCRDVNGRILESVTGPNTAAGEVTGDISGDVNIVITSLAQDENGVVRFQGICTMTTPQGTIVTHDNAVLTPIKAPFYRVNTHLAVAEGTGMYAGIAGALETHGTVNFVPGGPVRLHYKGQLCDRK